jgi:hypothetical protein
MSRTVSKRGPHKASASHDVRRGTYADAPDSRNFLDLLAKENHLNVYARELEVRPPAAPTTEPRQEAIDRL